MNRTLLLALCAVAFLAVIPTVLAEDNPQATGRAAIDADALPANELTAVHAGLADNMSEEQFNELTAKYRTLCEPERSSHFAENGTDIVRHEQYTWQWDNYAHWHVYLSVCIANGRVAGVSYLAWKESPALRAR